MPEGVKCSVANCSYWEQGNRCSANEIMVDIDKHAEVDYGSEFSGSLGSNHKDTAPESSLTCCHTFKLKEG